jgi:hypothetical protein
MKHCLYCHRQLIEIDYYGERLIGCIDCNQWGRPGDSMLPVQLFLEGPGSAVATEPKSNPLILPRPRVPITMCLTSSWREVALDEST